jgi:hypothetical protein
MMTSSGATANDASHAGEVDEIRQPARGIPAAPGAAPTRRRFMRAAICAPAVAVAAAAAGATPRSAAPAGDDTADATPCSTYHETAHIRTYYHLARY